MRLDGVGPCATVADKGMNSGKTAYWERAVLHADRVQAKRAGRIEESGAQVPCQPNSVRDDAEVPSSRRRPAVWNRRPGATEYADAVNGQALLRRHRQRTPPGSHYVTRPLKLKRSQFDLIFASARH